MRHEPIVYPENPTVNHVANLVRASPIEIPVGHKRQRMCTTIDLTHSPDLRFKNKQKRNAVIDLTEN